MRDTGATAEAHSDIANDMLAIHGLSGADTVATTAWHWQGNFHQIKDWSFSLSKVGVDNADMKSVEAQASNFICTIATYVRQQDRILL